MKVYVSCDIEGTAGVVDHRQQCQFDGAHYLQARRQATLELNAAVEGVLEAGASEVVAWNGHYKFPGGLDHELLHTECQLIMKGGEGGPVGLDGSFDAVLQVGLHAMTGTPGAVMAHGLWILNGVNLGEIGMTAQIAGLQGVPCVFVSGDQAAVDEAEALIPGIVTAAVKKALFEDVRGIEPGPLVTLSPGKACELIREKAAEAVGKVDEIIPFVIDPPYVLEWPFPKKEWADEMMGAHPEAERVDEHTLRFRNESFWSLPII